MRCYTTDMQAADEAFLVNLNAQLAASQATFLSMMASNVEQYRLDAGEGQQMVKDKDVTAVAKLIDQLKRMIDSYERKLNGCGIVNMALRRRRYR